MTTTMKKSALEAKWFEWLAWPEWAAAVDLSAAISHTVNDPERRAAFTARAAGDLLRTPPGALARMLAVIEALTSAAYKTTPTPAGAVELWDYLMRRCPPR
mgnify:CR=1 FL=1